MNRFFKVFMLGVIIALLAAVAMPIAAQDGVVEPSAPGEGGVIIQGNLGSDPSTFNPIIGNDATSSVVYGYLYPSIIAADDETFELLPGIADGMAADWSYDETGTVLTIILREDMFWSDGEQISADDWIWAVEATRSGLTTSPRSGVFYELADGTINGGSIHSVTKIDDFTIEVRLGTVDTDENGDAILDEDGNPVLLPACDALGDLNDIAVVPEHVFAAQFGDDYAAMDADPYFYGGASFGPFNDPFLDFGVQVSLLADQGYTDTNALDYVAAGEWVYQVYSDTSNNLLQVAAYIVTANKSVEKAEEDPHAIEYSDYQLIENIPIATNWNFYGWTKTEGLTDTLGNAMLSNFVFIPDNDSLYTPPSNFLSK